MARDSIETKSHLWIFIFVSLLILKLIITSLFPVIGDEAYYFYWGRHFSGGYYDLSPMIGWWEALFTRVSANPFWLRLPNLLVITLVTIGIRDWMKEYLGSRHAGLTALLYFFSPLPFLAVLISPDVPLVLFTFLSAFSFFQASREDRSTGARFLSYFISGALWGAAFLSKYFALFLLPALGIWFLMRKSSRWFGLFLFALGASPFLFQHLYWNATHCWATFVFNFVTRQHVYDGPPAQIIGLCFLYLILLATPFLLKDLKAKNPELKPEANALKHFVFLCWLVPITLFVLTAFMGKGQGLHWYFSYVPFFFMWMGLKLSPEKIRERKRQMMTSSLVLGMVAVFVLNFPSVLNGYFKTHYPFDFITAFYPHEWVDRLHPFLKESSVVLSDNYSMTSVLDQDLRRFVPEAPNANVWGDGSRFGRTYDWTIDWKALEGKKILFVTRGSMDNPRWHRYFSEIHVHEQGLEQDGIKTSFFISEGIGFHASAYINDVFKIAVGLYYPEIQSKYFSFMPARCELRE